MSRLNSLLQVTVLLTTITPANRILKATGTDGSFALATDPADDLMAVSSRAHAAANEYDDAHIFGVVPLEYGGTVNQGQDLTTDSQGRGVAATAEDNVIGKAWEDGALGTIGSVLLDRSTKPTPAG